MLEKTSAAYASKELLDAWRSAHRRVSSVGALRDRATYFDFENIVCMLPSKMSARESLFSIATMPGARPGDTYDAFALIVGKPRWIGPGI